MRIVSITVVDTEGKTHTWEGSEGFLTITNAQQKSNFPGGMAKIYGKDITAHLVAPLEEE